MKQVDLFIIGVQKAGTTSLKNYLGEHPDIVTHPHEEFAYFLNKHEQELGFDKVLKKYCIDKNQLKSKKLVLKNVGMCRKEASLKKLKEHSPNCKIILLLREPVARAYSSYTMGVTNGWMDRPFNEIREAVGKHQNGQNDIMYNQFIALGLYIEQLKLVYKYFPKEQVEIFLFEDLKTDPVKVCKKVFAYLGVNNDFNPNLKTVHNKTTTVKSDGIAKLLHSLRQESSVLKQILRRILPSNLYHRLGNKVVDINKTEVKFPPIDKESKAFLQKFYEPYNLKLIKEYNVDLKVWGITE